MHSTVRISLGVGSNYLAAEYVPASEEGNVSINPGMEVQLFKVQFKGFENELEMDDLRSIMLYICVSELYFGILE